MVTEASEAQREQIEQQFRKEIGIVDRFCDGFTLPHSSVVKGDVVQKADGLGVGFTAPAIAVHFVEKSTYFDPEQLEQVDALLDEYKLRLIEHKDDVEVNQKFDAVEQLTNVLEQNFENLKRQGASGIDDPGIPEKARAQLKARVLNLRQW